MSSRWTEAGRHALILTLLAAAAALPASSCRDSEVYTGRPQAITIGENPNETKALLYIAQERGFLAANGLNVVFKKYDSGAKAADGLLKGEADFATCAEYVVVGKVLERKKSLRIIASISRFENVYILGRVDKGIRRAEDLRGKRVGVSRGASSEFYLGRFLDLRGLSVRQVTLVDVPPARSLDALVDGRIDAVTVIEPHASTIERKLGDRIVVWPAQSGQLAYFTMVSTSEFVARNPEAIRRVLRSLVEAEDYVASHPQEAEAIVQKRLRYDDAYMARVWPGYQFRLSLDESLIAAMRDEARWIISNGLTTEKTVPGFLDYIYLDGLKAEKPEAVNIIR